MVASSDISIGVSVIPTGTESYLHQPERSQRESDGRILNAIVYELTRNFQSERYQEHAFRPAERFIHHAWPVFLLSVRAFLRAWRCGVFRAYRG